MVQVPTASSEAVDPETVQMAGVVEVKLTGSPELAVALSTTATEAFHIWAGIAPKVIVWAAGLTVKLCLTAGAAV